MFGRVRHGVRRRQRPGAPRPLAETMEPRRLLSATAASVTFHSDAQFLRPAASLSSDVQGYTPSQVRHAYGFDQLGSFNGVAADGTGQTIAIIDANNDPNLVADLGVFDGQFGLPAANLKIVNQNGGSQLPATDSGWAGEISLDVEWAHAIAPGANLLLVEAKSATINDLMAGVNYTRHAAGVSVVSMSWGGSEFFSFNGGEFASQTNLDPSFTTPSGHQGVTFVAAAGDSGAFAGVQWPASSPNVLSVGGTSLNVSDQAGTYAGESSWSGTSGGFSQVESEPTYQQNVQSTNVRTTPDVSLNGDPNTGFAVYDSLPDQGYSGWQVVGGTSAGSPQWAALVAIADQGRVASGQGTLDGATQTLPALYGLADSSSTYNANFNDVVDTGGGRAHFRFGGYGFSNNPATTGYDTATGLGTPKAAQLIQSLAGTSTSGGGGGGGTSTSTPTAPQLPASPITGTIVSSPPAGSVIEGSAGSLRLRLTNTGDTAFSGPIDVTLYASTDRKLTSDPTSIAAVSLPQVSLRAGASRIVRLKFNYATSVSDGTYFLVASVDATGTNTAPAQAVTSSAVTLRTPTVDLSAAFAAGSPITVNPGQTETAVVTIENQGNVTASGTVGVNLFAAAGLILDPSSDVLLAASPTRSINLRPGRSMTLRVQFQAPELMAGSYNLVAALSSSTQPADANASNDTAVAGTV